MFKLLRSKAKFLYWFIAISFILFMGLTDMGGNGCQNSLQQGPAVGAIGSVNGEDILASEYDQYYRSILNQMRQQSRTRDLNPNQYANAAEQAWNGLVRSRIMEDAMDEMDITVSDEELVDRFQDDPPAQVLANFRNQETGAIDMDAYYRALQDPSVDWSGIEAYVRNLMKSEKLQERLTSDITVTEDEVREEFINQTGQATAEYVGVLFTNLKDEYTPTEEEITAWYTNHAEDFAQPAKVKAQVVRYAKEPSEADYTEILNFAQEIREEILSGTISFEDAALEYSDDGSASRGGDLGTFDRNRMVAPFTEAAFSLEEGVLSEPVKTQFGYHIIEVTERHMDEETGEVFQVTARHILLKVSPSNDTLAMISEAAQAFADRVNGSTFVSTAQAEGLDLLSPVPFIEGRDIPGLSFSLSGSVWAHAAKPGDVSRVFETNDYFYIVRVDSHIPAGTAPLDDVRGQVTQAVIRDHNQKRAQELLNPVVGKAQMGTPLREAVGNDDLLTYAETDTFGVNDNVQNVGYGTEFNKLAINGQVGTLISEVSTQRGVFALVPTWIKPFDEEEFAARQAGLEEALLARKQAEYMEEWLSAKVEAAKIEDFRQSFR